MINEIIFVWTYLFCLSNFVSGMWVPNFFFHTLRRWVSLSVFFNTKLLPRVFQCARRWGCCIKVKHMVSERRCWLHIRFRLCSLIHLPVSTKCLNSFSRLVFQIGFEGACLRIEFYCWHYFVKVNLNLISCKNSCLNHVYFTRVIDCYFSLFFAQFAI